MRKRAGRQHDLAGRACHVTGKHDLDAIRDRAQSLDLGNLDDATAGAKILGERQRVEFRIGDRIPAGRERAADEAGRDARLDTGHLGGIHVPEFDTVLFAGVPAGQRGAEFAIAFIDLQIAFLAQHRKRFGRRQEGL
ncbi:hypothetical protein D3C71_1004870 [compost metagenome]